MTKVLCVIPALRNDVKFDTVQSVLFQSYAPEAVLFLPNPVKAKLPFPAKMSLVLNSMLEYTNISKFDYLLRVDADTILPTNFVEAHVRAGYDAVGAGYAQLIRVEPFLRLMGGRFHPDHDDGYIIEKFAYEGLKSSWVYEVQPVLKREPGRHHGGSWYVAQGDLKYKYGEEPLEVSLYLVKHWCPFTLFEFYGYFKALFLRHKRFDVADRRLYKRLRKYREPKRFLQLPKFAIRVMRGYNLE